MFSYKKHVNWVVKNKWHLFFVSAFISSCMLFDFMKSLDDYIEVIISITAIPAFFWFGCFIAIFVLGLQELNPFFKNFNKGRQVFLILLRMFFYFFILGLFTVIYGATMEGFLLNVDNFPVGYMLMAATGLIAQTAKISIKYV